MGKNFNLPFFNYHIYTFNILIAFFMFISPENSFSQWIRQYTGTVNPLYDIEFVNRNTGWACGSNQIYKTTNEGQNWVLQPNPAQSLIMQICPVDTNVVYAAGWFTILKTTNGGKDWIGILTGTVGSGYPVLNGVHFINQNTGWFCGDGKILKTTNGCQTWDSSLNVGSMCDIYFRNNLEGVSCGEYCMFKTTNGGENWLNIPIHFTTFMQMFHRLSFVNNQTGWVAGSGNNIYKTTNFGSNWDSISYINDTTQLFGIKFSSLNIGYTGGSYGKLYKTTDGGYSWRRENLNYLDPGYVFSIWTYNDSIIWASGSGGMIIHTTTGGQPIGITNINEKVPDKFILYQNYPNPFNPGTNIKYQITNSKFVTLKVYDVLGKDIAILVNESKKIGTYEVQFSNSKIPSGVYFYSLFIDGILFDTKRMLLIK